MCQTFRRADYIDTLQSLDLLGGIYTLYTICIIHEIYLYNRKMVYILYL